MGEIGGVSGTVGGLVRRCLGRCLRIHIRLAAAERARNGAAWTCRGGGTASCAAVAIPATTTERAGAAGARAHRHATRDVTVSCRLR